ncbi:hypothetical protein H1235_16865 [Pseudoxanthomonas sp. NC8]|nr:hypothetical protein H1235_16865 [Pseudoxanthomonas sp. NC8]
MATKDGKSKGKAPATPLALRRRQAEYDHHYGLELQGRPAEPPKKAAPAPRRKT